MKMNVVGMSERRQGTGSKSGKPYDGTTVHCTVERSRDVSVGVAVKEIYVNHLTFTDCPSINLGDLIDVGYDDKGYLESIEVVRPASQSNPFPALAGNPSSPSTNRAKKQD